MRLIQSCTVVLPHAEVLSSNGGRGHYQAHGKKVANIIQKTRPSLSALHAMDRAFIVVRVSRWDATQYDAQNLYETGKPMVDAVVRFGLLPDDDNAHVIGPLMVAGPVDRELSKAKNAYLGNRQRFVIEFYEDDDIRQVLFAS